MKETWAFYFAGPSMQRDTRRVWFRCDVPGCDVRGDATVPSLVRAHEFVALLNEAHTHAPTDTEETP